MDETTTTGAPVADGGQSVQGVAIDDQGMAIPQPENTDPAPAGEQTTEPTQPNTVSEEPPTGDNSDSDWLKNKGIDPSSPDAVEKLAKMAQNAEKAMHEKAKKASELEKSVGAVADQQITQYEQDNGTQLSETDRAVQKLVVKDSVRTFFDNNPDARPYEQAMIAELQNAPHLAGDLESLYARAVVSSGDSVKSQVRQETLETLAQKQTAAVPRGNAVNGSNMGASAITPQNVDQLVSQNSLEWFEQNRDAINAAMAG